MSKKLDKVKTLIDKTKTYDIDQALEILPQVSISKFVGSADLTVNFKLSEKQKQESIRGSVTFPHTFGEEKRVLVLAEPAKQAEAKTAGADYAGLEDLVKKIEGGWFEFDVVIATPSVMPQIAKLGKYLGRRGLMPNPKNQTVTPDVAKVVKMYKSGKKDYKMSEQDSIKIVFAKLDMNKDDMKANFEEFKKAIAPIIQKFTAQSIKGAYVSPTMGPSIKLDPNALVQA